MKFDLKKEIPFLILALLPLLYLYFSWVELPAEIPLLFDSRGLFGILTSKIGFAISILAILFTGYIIVWLVQLFDPENKYLQMGKKFYQFRLIIGIEMALFSAFFIYVAKTAEPNGGIAFVLCGIILILLGNIFQTIKIGHHLGYKVFWTIHSETIWNKTHRLAGVLCMGVGFFICVLYFIPIQNSITIAFSMMGLVLVIPFIYSYTLYRKEIKAM